MKIYIVISVLFISILQLHSEEYSDYIFYGGARINGNIYSSDFEKIGNYKNCCPNYESAFGLSPAFYGGVEKRNALNLFDYDLSYSLSLAYNDLSAKYSIRQHIGNDLGVDEYQKIIVEHELDINYALLGIENSFWFNPVKNIPLDIKFGINLSIPISKRFKQRELLIEPDGAYFPDGTREFNPASADIPDLVPIFASISLGARHRVYKFGDYEIFADAGFSYSPMNIASDLNLNIHQASLGISLHYLQSKPEPPRPAAAPMPEAPEPVPPPTVRKPKMNLLVDFDYKKVKSGDTLEISVDKFEYRTYAHIPPVLVFKKNSSELVDDDFVSNDLGSLYDANFKMYQDLNFPQRYAELIASYLTTVPEKDLQIIAESEDEGDDVLQERIDIVKSELISAGIPEENIKSTMRRIKRNKTNNPLIADESRKVLIQVSDELALIEVKVSSEEVINNFNKVLSITPVYFAEDTARFHGRTLLNGTNETVLKSGTNQIVLSSGMFISETNKPNRFDVIAEVEDSNGNQTSDSAVFYLTHKDNYSRRYLNLNKNDKTNEVEEFILGFTRFDKSDFTMVNNTVLDYVRAKVLEGRTIEIIPLTDNIGTDEYNKVLASQRAEAAVRLINLKTLKYEINYQSSEIFNNESPYGRIMNRSVLVRIK
ncbi:MAG: hypothetical protein RBT61_05565 [Candidatus Kapabacteria bacterium]|jgi:outer membrane protein OmpA-like peptidoglycan-associated protein|nr:hypothetical protein [Candidatus Kapabacteria bacterium]